MYRFTRGRLGDRLVDNDMLLLTTIGAQTKRRHSVPLLYLEEDEDLVVIASYGGRPANPQWYVNLVARPKVRVQIGASQFDATARTTSGVERAQLWARAVEAYAGYAEYQERTDREIPVVVLRPLRNPIVTA